MIDFPMLGASSPRTAEKVRLSCVRTARVRESLERHLEALANEIIQVEAAIARVIRTDKCHEHPQSAGEAQHD